MPIEGRGRYLDPKQIPQKDRDIHLAEVLLRYKPAIIDIR
jgi:hypothetical protein